MGDTCDSSRRCHSIQKFLLIGARILPRQLHFDVKGSTIGNPMTPYIGFTMPTDINHTAVFGIELTDGVVSGYAAVFTKCYDNLVLEFGFWINIDRLPCWLAIWVALSISPLIHNHPPQQNPQSNSSQTRCG